MYMGFVGEADDSGYGHKYTQKQQWFHFIA